MADINFSDAGQTPDNTAPLTGSELFFGAPSRGGLPIVYKMPFTTNGVTNPIVTFFGIVAGRNNFTVGDGSVTNIKVLNDLVGINTDTPDSQLTVVKNGVHNYGLASFKNNSNTNLDPAKVSINYGTGGLIVNFSVNVYNDAVTANGVIKKRSTNIDSDGVGGLSFSASNAAGTVSIFTGGKAAANEAIKVFSNGRVSIGFAGAHVDNGKAVDVNGIVRATSFEGGYSFANATDTKMTKALNEAVIVSVASASTTDIATASANTIYITGTTTINAFTNASIGATRRLFFAGALTLTNSANLQLPTGGNIVTATGDFAEFIFLSGNIWKCMFYQRASGAALSNPTFIVATMTAATPLNIGANQSEFIYVNAGVSAISTFDTVGSGITRTLIFNTSLTLVHGANLMLPTNASILTRVGDTAQFVTYGSGTWKCISYTRADGTSVLPSQHDFILMNFGVI